MFNVSKRTVREWIQDIDFTKNHYDKIEPQKAILLIDTTYFWRKYWYMIFRVWFPKVKKWKNVLRYKVKYETNDLYREWYKYLIKQWRDIVAIVCDWRQGLLWWFWKIPTQMCIYHMKQIITRYLTRKPKLEQNKRLKRIADCIWEYPEEDVKLALNVWGQENQKRLKERNIKWWYMHTRTRRAYRSIVNKLKWCYEFAHNPKLWIPKTNNSLEATNWHLKTMIKIHRWTKEKNKDKFTNYYLYIS